MKVINRIKITIKRIITHPKLNESLPAETRIEAGKEWHIVRHLLAGMISEFFTSCPSARVCVSNCFVNLLMRCQIIILLEINQEERK